MEKAIKLIITEETTEFSQESNATMKITTLRLLSAQKTEKNC